MHPRTQKRDNRTDGGQSLKGKTTKHWPFSFKKQNIKTKTELENKKQGGGLREILSGTAPPKEQKLSPLRALPRKSKAKHLEKTKHDP